MKISVIVKPNSKKESIEKLSTGEYVVRVNAPAIEGRANEAVIEALSTHFGVRKSAIRIVSGEKSKKKIS